MLGRWLSGQDYLPCLLRRRLSGKGLAVAEGFRSGIGTDVATSGLKSLDCGRVSDEVKEIRFVLSNAPIVNELLAVMDRTRCRGMFAHGSAFQRHVHRVATVVYYAIIPVCICRCGLVRDTPTLNAYGSW